MHEHKYIDHVDPGRMEMGNLIQTDLSCSTIKQAINLLKYAIFSFERMLDHALCFESQCDVGC